MNQYKEQKTKELKDPKRVSSIELLGHTIQITQGPSYPGPDVFLYEDYKGLVTCDFATFINIDNAGWRKSYKDYLRLKKMDEDQLDAYIYELYLEVE